MPEVVQVTSKQQLDGLVGNFEKVVVDFSAPSWCVPCQRLAPHFKAAAEKLTGQAILAEVDIDTADSDLVQSYSIMSVPTVKAFKNGSYVSDIKARTTLPLIAEVTAL